MATKTISVNLEAYDRLASARTSEKESFSKVICRAVWPEREGSAADLLALVLSHEPRADTKLLDEAQDSDSPPVDPWDEA